MSKTTFKRTRKLTKSLLKMALDQEYFVKIVSPVVEEEKKGKQELDDDGKPKKEVFHLMEVINLETGEDNKILVNKVLEDILNEYYPDNTYVGKGFALTKFAKQAGRKYHTFNVEEIELPDKKEEKEVEKKEKPAPLKAAGK